MIALCVLLSGLIAGPAGAEEAASASTVTTVSVGERAGFAPGSMILWGSDAALAADLDAMAATGARWVRVDFDWPSIEPTRGSFNWKHTDRVITAAQARGLQILALPTYTPSWARPAGTTGKYPPSDPAHFANFVQKAAERYSAKGVAVWEIWNEPNISMMWSPKPDAAGYTRLLAAASTAIHAVDPAATVLVGGLSPAVDAVDGSKISPITFTKQLYAAGAKPHFDAHAVHPYSYPASPMDPKTSSWNTFYRLPLVRDVMVANGDGHKQIWLTEYGAPTSGTAAVDEATQARFVTEAFAAVAAWDWAGPLFWYSLRDAGTDPVDREDNFGVLRHDFSPKAAYPALLTVLAAPLVTETTTTTAPAPAPAPAPVTATAPTTQTGPTTAPTSADRRGYRLAAADGTVHAFGDRLHLGALNGLRLARPIVGVAETATAAGYWLVASDGGIFAFGDAAFHGSTGNIGLNQPIVGMAATPTGRGYWLVARDGGIFAFGDAGFHGSTGNIRLKEAIVGMTPTSTGRGYWLVASDGGIFAFGDAAFHGSTGALRLKEPVVGMARTAAGNGYWLVASDGGIFSFGDAGFHGSTGALRLAQPITGMTPMAAGAGYWLVARDGGLFTFGSGGFHGSAAGLHGASNPVVGMA